MLAFVDLRPWLVLLGLPVGALLALVVALVARRPWRRGRAAALGATGAAVLLLFLLYGPFVGRTVQETRRMTWRIERGREGFAQAEVILGFKDEPGRWVGDFSDQLADHLMRRGEPEVSVVFEWTVDYGMKRGFRLKEVAGLRGWASEWSYAGGPAAGGPP
jgi:hypothetical protein